MIVGQKPLVSGISRIFDIFEKSKCQIKPNFIITGPSGSGKTYTVKTLAEKHKFGFVEINAAQLTKEGMSGNSLSKALTPLLNLAGRPTIVFADEFDKLFISGNTNDSMANESTVGVQNEFLKILEGETTQVFGDYGKYITVSLKNVLFVFSGAFNGEEDLTIPRLQEIGLKTEFLGRVGLMYNATKLSLEDLFVLIENNKLINQYCELFSVDKKTVEDSIKDKVRDMYDTNTIGARMIHMLVHQHFING
jgi:ATP-dependent protease Clp ATPase subunit